VEYSASPQPILEVLGHQVTLRNEELLHGEVTFALLTVYGRVKQATLTKGGTCMKDPKMSGFEDIYIASVELDAFEHGKESISNMNVWLLGAGIQHGHRAVGLVLAPARLPDQSEFGGPLPILDRNADLSPLNAFSPEHADVESEALVHLRRRPTPPCPWKMPNGAPSTMQELDKSLLTMATTTDVLVSLKCWLNFVSRRSFQ